MAITYVNDLRLSEMGTGDNSGTWGTVTNTNLELIGEALGFGTEAITTNADTHASTIADGSTDPVRAMYVKYTGTLDSACTITIGPNTVNKFYYIENATSGSQNIIISQGSGANVTIPAGDVKAVYLDGAGSGAAVVDAFASLNVVDLKVQDDLTVTDDMTVGGTLGVTGVLTATSLDISGDIDVDGTTNLDVVDIDGAVDMASTLQVDGAITSNGLLTVDGSANSSQAIFTGTAGRGLEISTFSVGAADEGVKLDATASGTTGKIILATNGNNKFTMDGTGDIILAGTSNADEANKSFNLQMLSHDTNEENVNVLQVETEATFNQIAIGGGTSALNAATKIKFSTAAIDTVTGVERMSIGSTGNIVFNDTGADSDFRIESDGNANMFLVDASADTIGIGTTQMNVVGNNAAGINFLADGMVGISRAGVPLKINRTAEGGMIELYEAATARGQIDIESDRILVRSTGDASGIRFDASGLTPFKNGSAANGTVDLGFANGQFRDIFLSNGVVFGPASGSSVSSQTLDEYEEGTWTPAAAGLSLSSVSANYTRVGDMVHYGFTVTLPTTTATTHLKFTGLPYSVGTDIFGGSLIFTSSSVTAVQAICVSASNDLQLYKAGSAFATYADFNGSIFRVSGAYKTDA